MHSKMEIFCREQASTMAVENQTNKILLVCNKSTIMILMIKLATKLTIIHCEALSMYILFIYFGIQFAFFREKAENSLCKVHQKITSFSTKNERMAGMRRRERE